MEAHAHLVLLYCGGWVDSKNVYWASFCTLASSRRVFKPSDRGCHTHVVKSHHQTRLQPRLETGEAVNFTIDQMTTSWKAPANALFLIYGKRPQRGRVEGCRPWRGSLWPCQACMDVLAAWCAVHVLRRPFGMSFPYRVAFFSKERPGWEHSFRHATFCSVKRFLFFTGFICFWSIRPLLPLSRPMLHLGVAG